MKNTDGFDDGNPTPAVVDLVVKFVVVVLPKKKNDGFVIGNLFFGHWNQRLRSRIKAVLKMVKIPQSC